MCGIAGYIGAEGHRPGRELLRRMCDRLSHRGPDAYGEFHLGAVSLGHRRLSIIDLSGGGQPLGNEDGSIQIVFNGEIYNFQELRAELVAKGHRFATRSDTEVLVHLYEEEGERMPEKLNGMFAFAIWDEGRKELFLARDRLGKKPLYYSFSTPGLRIVFASELKALLEAPGFGRKINHQAVADFLCFSYVPDPGSIYQDVLKLEPGSSLTVSREGSRLRKYWRPDFPAEPTGTLDATVEQIQEVAADAVRIRMVSDVPLGAFLSGGVDSSAVTGIMAEASSQPVKSFSIGFSDKNFDELKHAAVAARHNHTDHREEVVTPEVFEALEKLTEHFDEPFGDSSAIPMLYLSRLTRRHVTVALSGDGADELFGGYRRYRYGVLEERLRGLFPSAFRRHVIGAGARYYPKLDFMPQVFRAKSLLTNISQDIADAYFSSMTALRDDTLNSVLSSEVREKLNGYSPREAYRKRFERVKHLDPLRQMQAVDLETYLPGDILVKADRATMASSIESRSPFLDYRLAELAARLPASLNLHNGIGKYAFKKAMERWVPRELIDRKKMGFSVPLASWMRTSLKPVFESAVLATGAGGLLDCSAVRRLWNEHQSGVHNHDKKLWNLLILGLWSDRYQGPARSGRGEVAQILQAGSR